MEKYKIYKARKSKQIKHELKISMSDVSNINNKTFIKNKKAKTSKTLQPNGRHKK